MTVDHVLPDAGTMISFTPPKSTNYQKVVDGFKRLGLEKSTPDKRTPMACLKSAIAEVFGIEEIADDPKAERRVIDPQPKGFVVGVKRPKDKKNPGDRLGNVKISITLLDEKTGDLDMDPWDREKVEALQAGMAGAAQWLASGPCVAALREIVTVWGLAMDSHGGWYWLPSDMMTAWKMVEQVMVDASAHKDKDGEDVKPWVFDHINCQRDEEWHLSMIGKLVAEMDAKVKAIEESLYSGELGTRAINYREKASQHLLDKVANFESILGTKLDKLKNDISVRIQTAACQAKLAAIVKAEQEAAQAQGSAA